MKERVGIGLDLSHVYFFFPLALNANMELELDMHGLCTGLGWIIVYYLAQRKNKERKQAMILKQRQTRAA